MLVGLNWQLKYKWHTWPAAHVGSLFKKSRVVVMEHAFGLASEEFVSRSKLGDAGSFTHAQLHGCFADEGCAAINLPGATTVNLDLADTPRQWAVSRTDRPACQRCWYTTRANKGRAPYAAQSLPSCEIHDKALSISPEFNCN